MLDKKGKFIIGVKGSEQFILVAKDYLWVGIRLVRVKVKGDYSEDVTNIIRILK